MPEDEVQMEANTRAFARNMFRLRVHEAKGQAYEDLFVRVMQYADKSFSPVKASGRLGDRSNDGYSSKAGAYYQVYAPEDIGRKEDTAVKKLGSAFVALKDYWDTIAPVRQFFFVVNDRYAGVSPACSEALAEIVSKHRVERAELLLVHNLEDRLFELSDDVIMMIVGHVPCIQPSDFLFLSGFTCFLGAWIDFERTARGRVQNGAARPLAGRQLVEMLASQGLLSPGELRMIFALNKLRNPLVHGDSTSLPRKEQIDALVSITERLKCG